MSGPAPVPPTPPPQPARMPPRQDNTLAVLSCLLPLLCILAGLTIFAFLPPLIIWQKQKERDIFTAETAREVLNVQFSLMLYGFGIGAVLIVMFGLASALGQGGEMGREGLSLLIPATIVCFVGMILLFIYDFVVCILAAVRASNGDIYRAPLNLRLF